MSTNRKYTKELLQEAVADSKSFAGVLRHLGLKQAGGTQSHVTKMIRQFEIDTSHFNGKGWNLGGVSLQRKEIHEILVILPEGSNRPRRKSLHRAMTESGVEEKCVGCGIGPKWCGKTLTLEIDHIDGNWLNNLLENLRFLCPNCHSQCETNKSWKNSDCNTR